MMEDEIVITMSVSDHNLLNDTLLWAALHQVEQRQDRIKELIHRISHTSERLTLSWLDHKRKRFP